MSDKSQQFLLVGLPATGKTSFLAALWYMVDQTEVPCKLKLERLEGDRKYLNDIRDAWVAYKPVPHTQVDTEKIVSMFLRNQDTAQTTTLSFPDLSGEAFRLQWTKREMSRSYAQRLHDSTGALLFIHPSRIAKPHRIDEVEEASSLVSKAMPSGAPSGGSASDLKSWDPEKSPTQIQLIELLQFIASRENLKTPFRLAIVISAFDLAAATQLTAADLLSRELPMLKQYLDANSHIFECTCYGISAQGAEYRSPELTSAMILDADSLKNRIAEGPEPVCQWLREQLDDATKAVIATPAARPDLKDALADGLNGLLARGDLYDATRFAAVPLREDTRYRLDAVLLKNSKERTDIVGLNRMLLEDAFPKQLATVWSNDAGHFRLAKCHPAERVTVVGADVQNQRDLTEPIQWLMR